MGLDTSYRGIKLKLAVVYASFCEHKHRNREHYDFCLLTVNSVDDDSRDLIAKRQLDIKYVIY